ncbi:MAG: baseplate J/gp47 family protein [Bacteroidota bacterium]
MSCEFIHILPRDGTNQLDRHLAALGADYVQIEERSSHEWYAFAKAMSTEINFFQLEQLGLPIGRWEHFFQHEFANRATFERWFAQAQRDQQLHAHLTLFLTFLKLLEYLKDDLNELGQRHLDYYYRDILGFQHKTAIPDKVHVLVELASTVEQHLLQAGTLLKAGKDPSGQNRAYQLDKDTVFNQTQIVSLKSVMRDVGFESRIFAAPVANSVDGQGKDAGKADLMWSPFGESQQGLPAVEQNMVEADIGLAIASPILLLKEGTRKITLTVYYSGTIGKTPEASDFTVWGSGEKEWIPISFLPTQTGGIIHNPGQLILELELGLDKDALVNYETDTLGHQLQTRFPVLRILLNKDTSLPFPYDAYAEIEIEKVHIEVDVEGVRNLILQNDEGSLDANGKFFPFGARPLSGSTFLIGSQEVFSKELSNLKLDFEWVGAPEDFNAYYANHTYGTVPAGNEVFEAKIEIQDQGSWTSLDDLWKLFPSQSFAALNPMNEGIGRMVALPDFESYHLGIKRGFLRMTLGEEDFRHTSYARDFATNIVGGDPEVINPPYTPEIKYISLDYTSSIEIQVGTAAPDQFFHIEPFGSRRLHGPDTAFFLPQLPQGSLYIGLEKLQPPQNLSLLFQILDGSGDPEVAISSDDIQWSILSGDEWKVLSSLEILEDHTYALQTSGIMQFTLGAKASTDHHLLPKGIHWLRATLDNLPAGAAKFRAIHAQAAQATWLDQENDPAHLLQPLEANTIQKLTVSQAAVKRLQQPYVSFGGTVAEQDRAFYTRVSERLRHKKRAITLWDYEHLVLEAFPDIYKVKCINHYTQEQEIEAGYVTVVVIPNLRNQNAIDLLKPRVSTAKRAQILEYLQAYVSLFVELEVLNPIYEEIQLDMQVRFRAGYDPGFYARQLNEEIIRFLSPWAFEEGQDIIFGGKVYKSMLIDFVEEREYVDFVTNFKLLHFRNGIGHECIGGNFVIGPEATSGIAEATTPRSILVSAAQHQIHILAPGDYPCEQVAISGIGSMIVDGTFIVS